MLDYSMLDEAALKKQKFSGVSLRGVNFSDADLEKADLSGCDLTETIFRNTKLKGADLRGVKWDRTDIRNARLEETAVDLDGAVYLARCMGAVLR